jgi:hypothetical protein
MNEEQKQDLENIAKRSDESLRTKYTKGAIEHNDLLDQPLEWYLLNALDENTDQRVYILKALEKVDKILAKYNK